MKALSARAIAAAAVSILVTLSAVPGRAADIPDLSGVYWASRYSPKVEIAGGGDMPFSAAGKAAYEQNVAGLKDGTITDDARRYCVPDGLPRVLATPYPFEIVQAPPGQVTMLYELNHQIRVIRMDKPMASDEYLTIHPAYNGYSIGHYEGDTLVVETAGFNGKTFADAVGAPQSDAMKTLERIRKLNPKQLEILITVHDPEYYARDWQARFVYNLRNDVRIEDYLCGEPHRDISSVEGVRRP